MKKQNSILWLMVMVLCATFTLTACSDDDDDNKALDKLETSSYDDLDYFQRAIVDVDSLGHFLSRKYGVPLYDNDTTHLYIGVESLEAAEKVFRHWIAPDIDAATADDGSITANLTAEDGKAQGTVWFRPASAGGKVAEVTASHDTRLLHFSQITFLQNSAWPFNNAASKWHVGDVVHNVHLDSDIESKFDSGDIPREWVCIRESGSTMSIWGMTIGIPPMFCAITRQSYNVPARGKWVNAAAIADSKYCPSLSTADAVKSLLHQDWDFYVACFADSGNGSPESDGYWIDNYHTSWFQGFNDVYYYNSGFHYGEDQNSKVMKPFLLVIDWVDDGQMHDGGTY